MENIWLIRYPFFFAAAMLGWWYLRRTNRETPVRNATLFTATALAFLFIPGYFSTGADTASAVSVAVAAAAAIVPCVVIILVLGTRKRD